MQHIKFDDFLINNQNEFGLVGSEFRLVISDFDENGNVTFYCHPQGRSGDTYDGVATGFNVYPKTAIDNLLKYINK